jgi:hypothetical protein
MTTPANLIGQRFNRLTVTERTANDKHGNSRWLCLCDCGTAREAPGQALRNGKVKSCGCTKLEATVARNKAATTHGHTAGGKRSRTFISWVCMRERCTYPSDKRWAHYGGRGIKVCERWQQFENFLADMGERPEGVTLDRKDVNGDYTPDNCRWATNVEQRANRRT